MAATVAHLPAQALEGIWDNLIYDDNIKQNLLNYIHATQLFGDKQVDFNVITWNRSVIMPLLISSYDKLTLTPHLVDLSFCMVRRERGRQVFAEL